MRICYVGAFVSNFIGELMLDDICIG